MYGASFPFSLSYFSQNALLRGVGKDKGETEKLNWLVMVEITIFQLCFCTSIVL